MEEHDDWGTTVLDPKMKEETKPKLKKPSKWMVIILNDDFTPMEFVEELLMRLFNKTREEASAITQEIHTKGKGVAMVTTFEVGETKIGEVALVSRQAQHPLRAVLEKAP